MNDMLIPTFSIPENVLFYILLRWNWLEVVLIKMVCIDTTVLNWISTFFKTNVLRLLSDSKPSRVGPKNIMSNICITYMIISLPIQSLAVSLKALMNNVGYLFFNSWILVILFLTRPLLYFFHVAWLFILWISCLTKVIQCSDLHHNVLYFLFVINLILIYYQCVDYWFICD